METPTHLTKQQGKKSQVLNLPFFQFPLLKLELCGSFWTLKNPHFRFCSQKLDFSDVGTVFSNQNFLKRLFGSCLIAHCRDVWTIYISEDKATSILWIMKCSAFQRVNSPPQKSLGMLGGGWYRGWRFTCCIYVSLVTPTFGTTCLASQG